MLSTLWRSRWVSRSPASLGSRFVSIGRRIDVDEHGRLVALAGPPAQPGERLGRARRVLAHLLIGVALGRLLERADAELTRVLGGGAVDRVLERQRGDPPDALLALVAGRPRARSPRADHRGLASDSAAASRPAEKTGNGGVWADLRRSRDGGDFPPVGGTSDLYGGARPGSNSHTSSLVSLDAKTGKLRWARQLVHHDIWD